MIFNLIGGGGSSSVGGSGCGPTSICNIVSALTQPNLTPSDVFKLFCKKGYMTAGSGSYWDAIPAAQVAEFLVVELR